MQFENGATTAFLETCATAIGVGMVIGGFVAGLVGVLGRVPRETAEAHVLRAGYVCAAFCLVLRVAEIV